MFRIVENALNYRVYPLDLTIVKKSWELKKLSEIHDKSIVATQRILTSNSSPRMERSETAATFEPYGRFAKDAKFPVIFPREVEILL